MLSKVFERLMSVRLGPFRKVNNQFAFRKGLGTCDALLCVSYILPSALESGQEARIVQNDFSAAFDNINHEREFSMISALWVLGALCCQY